MTYSVITISRTLGAGGEELGTTLAGEYGKRYVDGEIIERAAQMAGVTAPEVARVEARKGFMQRILDNLARSGGGFGEFTAAASLVDAPGYEDMIVEVIKETAAAGNCVIVAHGAAIPLAGTPGVLRILVTASPEVRAARLVSEAHGELRAKKMVEESDAARADFLQRFYQVEEAPTNYDLVVNTDHVDIDRAAALVRALMA